MTQSAIYRSGSRGGSAGSVEPPKVKHNTIHFLLKKDLLNSSNNKIMQVDVCPNPPSLNPGSASDL